MEWHTMRIPEPPVPLKNAHSCSGTRARPDNAATVYEYNFSRQNEGGCVMFCLEEAIHSRFCNNVSFDDLSGTISPAQNPDALLSHNRYYVRKGIPFVRKNMDGGTYTQKADEIILLEEEER